MAALWECSAGTYVVQLLRTDKFDICNSPRVAQAQPYQRASLAGQLCRVSNEHLSQLNTATP